ncbi:MAG TPA: hypothetical protein DCE22_03555, partial [Verrucomicrobiales bacterium]|nr:hypothetical protein [Verrucomicrobiales bacterium]
MNINLLIPNTISKRLALANSIRNVIIITQGTNIRDEKKFTLRYINLLGILFFGLGLGLGLRIPGI